MDGSATVTLRATLGTAELNLAVTVPAGPTQLDTLLPVLQVLSDKLVSAAEEAGVERGACVSCRKGCGACCRQLVPVSPVEARHLARLVEEMPEPRRSQIKARFAAARERLAAAGLWQRLDERRSWPEEGVSEIGLAYFRLGIACPFLEDESCSIHRERPLTCREYLVTSPAEHCADPTPHNIEWLPMPAKVWVAAARCESGTGAGPFVEWVPLIQALEWAEANPPPAAQDSGPELLKRVLESLAGSGNATRGAAALAAAGSE